jgi:hypothetical protein
MTAPIDPVATIGRHLRVDTAGDRQDEWDNHPARTGPLGAHPAELARAMGLFALHASGYQPAGTLHEERRGLT